MAVALEPRAEVLEVVDLAVVDDPHGPLRIGHRLPPCRGIDHAEPAGAKRQGLMKVESLVVWTTVVKRSGHPSQDVLPNSAIPVGKKPGDAAHERLLPGRG